MEQSVSKRRHIKVRHRGITQKKENNIQNKAKVWYQGLPTCLLIAIDAYLWGYVRCYIYVPVYLVQFGLRLTSVYWWNLRLRCTLVLHFDVSSLSGSITPLKESFRSFIGPGIFLLLIWNALRAQFVLNIPLLVFANSPTFPLTVAWTVSSHTLRVLGSRRSVDEVSVFPGCDVLRHWVSDFPWQKSGLVISPYEDQCVVPKRRRPNTQWRRTPDTSSDYTG